MGISEKDYREGSDDIATEQTTEAAPAEDPTEAVIPPDELKDLQTAFLLVMTKDGSVLPVVSLDNLEMDRVASPREVYRMCMDAADQLSSVAQLGEMANIITTVQRESQKFLAAELAKLLMQMNAPKQSPADVE